MAKEDHSEIQAFVKESFDSSVSPICIGLSACSGCAMTIAAIVVALPEHNAKVENYKRSSIAKMGSIVGNLIFTNVGVFLQILAVGYGPVAIVTPICSGANLLSNLILQPILGIAHYTQDAIIGTLVLVCSILMLIEVGPSDIDPNAPVLDLLLTPYSMCFIGSAFFLMISSIYFIVSGTVQENVKLVFLYSTVGGTVIVINTALTKVVQMELPTLVRLPMILVYIILAVIGLVNGARANGDLDDPTLVVPIGAGLNLVLTCVAGLMIWGDGRRIGVPMTYFMIYLLVFLGSYLVCKEDLIGVSHHLAQEAHVKKLTGQSDGYEDTDLTPSAPRGRLSRWVAVSNAVSRFKSPRKQNSILKDTVKTAVANDEDPTDKLLDMWEESLIRYTPGTWNSPELHSWVLNRFDIAVEFNKSSSSSGYNTGYKPMAQEPVEVIQM